LHFSAKNDAYSKALFDASDPSTAERIFDNIITLNF
jgi:hypothetical protein